MEDILTTPEIVELVNDNYNIDTSRKLAYEQIFPMEYVPETNQYSKTYICFDVDIQGVGGKTFMYPILYVWVFTHKSLLRLPEGGIRTDALCAEICKKINGSREYGLGELNLYAVKRFAPMTDYQGKCMIFHAADISKFNNPKQYTPANRRQ